MAAIAAQPDPDDLEALFDQVAAQARAAALAPVPAADPTPGAAPAAPQDMFHRIGALTRSLHESLRELGYDKTVESAVGALPDARARLAYIANLTGQAAEKVLAAVERGQAVQAGVQSESKALAAGWDRLMAGALSAEEFKVLAGDSRRFVQSAGERAGATSALLTDIMMAQDFHDLTGQVIHKVVEVAQALEDQLLKLLIEATPPELRSHAGGFLDGPVVDARGRDDVVRGQEQVDDLLASLGF